MTTASQPEGGGDEGDITGVEGEYEGGRSGGDRGDGVLRVGREASERQKRQIRRGDDDGVGSWGTLSTVAGF